MWPWAHAAVAYLLSAGIGRYRGTAVPADGPTIALAVGAVLPDLIDKPLAWYLAILPHGRTFAHSLLVGGVLVGVGVALAHRRGHGRVAGAFALGYGVHIAGDAYQPLLTGAYRDLFFLAWPLTTPPQSETIGLLAHLQSIDLTPFFAFEVALTVAGLALWAYQGSPGLSTVWEWVRPGVRSSS